jgi:uncharacterized membrane protein YhaH (DUF805 family)
MFFIIGFSLLLFLAQSENFIEYYQKEFWKRSFDFDGETSRKSFWTVFGWNLLIELILVFIGLGTSLESSKKELSNYFVLVPFYGYIVISLIPNISIQIRRLRDLGKNPLWILINFVPLVGGIILLIFYGSISKEDRRERKFQLIEDLLSKGKIDEEEYKYMRKQILLKFMD